MCRAERDNNKKGGTFYGSTKGYGVFPIEIFGIKNLSRSGLFTMNEIIQEIKNQRKWSKKKNL
jgi:hypothetical protein